MKTILVRYKTASKERAEENAALIHGVFDQLRESGTAGVRYTTYRLADGVTFLHLATTENEKENPIPALPAFQTFQERIKERCVEPPVVTELSSSMRTTRSRKDERREPASPASPELRLSIEPRKKVCPAGARVVYGALWRFT